MLEMPISQAMQALYRLVDGIISGIDTTNAIN